MATLPSCMYWTFTNTGLLIQDWLLKPVRPINLNEAIHQFHLSSVIYSQNQFINSIEKLNHDNITTTTTSTIYNDKIQQIIQIIFYFSLPLLPAATILFAIVNIFIESKHYTCPKYKIITHPYIQNISQYLIVYYILTCINSSLIWLIILPRYIPMSFGYYNIKNKNLTSSYIDILNDNNNNNNTPKFITQLPAMLTMQIVLRLTLCWLIIGLLINRIYILNELYMNPLKKSFSYYINYLYTFIKQNLNDDHCLTTFNNQHYNHNNKGILLNDYKQQNQPIKSILQNVFKFTANLCSIQKCPICKSINYNWSENYVCFICKPNYNHNLKIFNQQIIKNKLKNENIDLSNIINMKKMNCTIIGRLILMISLLITCSLAICLPQVWSYQLIGINLKIKLFNQFTTTSTTDIEQISKKYYPAWRLLNKTGQTLYEYCFAAISFVIPCCTMIVCLLLLIIRLIKLKYEFNHIILHNIHYNKKDIKFYQLYINIIKYCLIYLIQDSILILIIGIIQLCCTIPYLMTNSINRLECLLINNQSKNQFIPILSSIATTTTSPPPPPATTLVTSSSSSSIVTESFWPTRQNWLFIEMNNLFGDFLIQLIIFSIHLCETNYLLINNYKFNNFDKNIMKYQYHNYELNELMKLHEINEKFIEYHDNYECNQHEVDNDNDNDDGNHGIDDHDNDDSNDDNDDDANVNNLDHDNNHIDINIENGNRKKLYTYRMKTPTDSGQTSKNISPLPISHTISDILLSPKFRSKQTMYKLNQQYRTHRSTPSTLPSPLLQRIPEIINYDPSHHYQQQQQQQQRNNNCNSFTTKYPMNSYVEPKTNMASLTYSPRSRHPCRLQNKIIPNDSNKSINNNTGIHLSNSSSLIQSTKLITTPNMNLTRIQQNQQIRNNSPPPLPPPPKHLIYMLGGDSSIYSTPHGSPQQVNTRKHMILNSPNSNTSNNNNNISVDYSPDLLHVSNISKHESSTTGSFRQTDSGVTNMGGSLFDSEQYEPNTIVT
ncbi:unnamed protein product [Schistosoma margrebowiei]|uniref:Uncharacterized protein n=1 Tax=Schistosoma margrebowiei TaxID=48269 RepID=A0AA85AMS6_9TREM|nr:unnamed protein product [Schistosoma margrebowiei]